MELTQETQDFLAHHGVLGMHWGKHKQSVQAQAASNRAAGNDKRTGFFNKPNAAKAILLGSYGKKSSYTDPHALKVRKAAGRVRIAAFIASAGASAASAVAVSSGNPTAQLGASYISKVLQSTAGLTGLAAGITGAVGAHEENIARANRG